MSNASGKSFRLRNGWYNCWKSAIRRCTDPNHQSFGRYNKKGIKCFLTREECAFLWERDKAHLLKIPSLDRKNPDDHYSLENCRFIEFVDNCKRHNYKPTEEVATKEEQWTD